MKKKYKYSDINKNIVWPISNEMNTFYLLLVDLWCLIEFTMRWP